MKLSSFAAQPKGNLVAQTYGHQNIKAGDEELISGSGTPLEHRSLADAL
jgi:hypothetical protein